MKNCLNQNMLMIKHVLKDGTEVDDITGYVIRIDDHEALYKLIDLISKKGNVYEALPTSD